MRDSAARDLDTSSQSWAAAACDSLIAVATTALGLSTVLLGPVASPAAGSIGAYIPVITPSESLQIGIVADETSCRHLVRGLLQMSPDDELSSSDVDDAFGEIANMVAGMTKAAMSSTIGVVGLGLPMVIHGWVAPSETVELGCMGAELGNARVAIVIVRRRDAR